MTIAASAILQKVVLLLVDATSIRWPIDELIGYHNSGQREIVTYRPDAIGVTASIAMVAGSRQTLPATATKLGQVYRNTSGAKRGITHAPRQLLEEQVPGWHALAGVTEILHYVYDPLDPKVFYVYPPAASSGASVEALYFVLPTDIAAAGAGKFYSDVVGNISVPDIFENALIDYILYRAWSKDSEFAENERLAAMHYAAFANALGIEQKATVGVAAPVAGNLAPQK